MAFPTDTLKSLLASPMLRKIVTFGLIGVGNATVDLAVFALAYNALSLPLVPANVMAWFVAASGSYVLNSMITFRVESGQKLRLRDYLRFLASGIVGVVAATTTLVLLSQIMPVYAAKAASILVSFVVNFTMSNFVVFRKRK